MSIGTLSFKGLSKKSFFNTVQGQYRTAKSITAIGNAKVSTTASMFGGSSAYFSSVGSYLELAASSDFAWGTGDFTYECFFYTPATLSSYAFIFEQRSGPSAIIAPTIYWYTGVLRYFVNGADRITYTWTPTAATWYHFSVCRSGSSIRMFIDGVQVGSTYTDSSSYVMGGTFHISDATWTFPGYIDEIRVSATARYTTTFTRPSSSFVNDSYTKLLIHCDGANNSTVFTDMVY